MNRLISSTDKSTAGARGIGLDAAENVAQRRMKPRSLNTVA